MIDAVEQVYSLNSLKYAAEYPELNRVIQHDQIFTEYGAAWTPELIDRLPYRYVQLLRLCIQEKTKNVKTKQKKTAFYGEVGVQQASMARF